MRAAASLLLLPVALLTADVGDLTVVEEWTELDRHYVEWSIEGVDSLRIAFGLRDTTPAWFFIRQHHSGVWDPVFAFLPIMVDGAGTHWLGQPRMCERLDLTEEDGEYLLGVCFDHGLTHWYSKYISIPWQYRMPAIRFTGAPEYYSAMSTSPLTWERMTLEGLREEMGPQVADSLMIPFPDFEVHWDQIIDAPVLDRDSVAAMDTLWFELSAIGLHGNISSTTFEVDPVSDLRIHVWERFRWNIFYNEYGCGACWREQGVPGAWSEWLQLERRGNIYTTLDVYQEEPYTPVIPEEDYAMANAWAERQSTYYVVFDGPNVVEFRIVGESSGGTSVEKYVMFLIEPGD